MKQNNYVRLLQASRELVSQQLSHAESAERHTIYGNFSYNRLSGDVSINWTVDCPLSLSQKLVESLKFLRLCGRL